MAKVLEGGSARYRKPLRAAGFRGRPQAGVTLVRLGPPRVDSQLIVNHTHVMSKRLQVILGDEEMEEIRDIARAQKTTVAEWVRRALRAARRSTPSRSREQKLAAIRLGSDHAFPAGDIESVLEEIERGYGGGCE